MTRVVVAGALFDGWDFIRGVAMLFDGSTGQYLSSFEHNENGGRAAISPDGSLLLAGGERDDVQLWNVHTGEPSSSAKRPVRHPRIGPAIALGNGWVKLQLSSPSGQCVRVQRSADLVDWEDWRTVTLEGTRCEVIDEITGASQRFYRAVDDHTVAAK